MRFIDSMRLKIARFILSNYFLPRGKHRISKILLSGISKFPSRASFKFKYGYFDNVSIKKWPWGYWELWVFGVLDEEELYYWKRFVRSGDVVVDVGANYGYWTLVASKLVGDTGKVFSFEPIITTYNILMRNVEKSNAGNVSVFNLALSNTEGTSIFNISSEDGIAGSSSQGKHSIVNFDSQQEVKMVPLDVILPDDVNIRLIKIDVEGGELLALQGMEKILKKQMPIITFEWNVNTAKGMNYHPDEIINYLQSFGYSIKVNNNYKLIDFDKSSYPWDLVLMLWAIPTTQ